MIVVPSSALTAGLLSHAKKERKKNHWRNQWNQWNLLARRALPGTQSTGAWLGCAARRWRGMGGCFKRAKRTRAGARAPRVASSEHATSAGVPARERKRARHVSGRRRGNTCEHGASVGGGAGIRESTARQWAAARERTRARPEPRHPLSQCIGRCRAAQGGGPRPGIFRSVSSAHGQRGMPNVK